MSPTRIRAPRWHLPYLALIGLLAGAAAGMNHLTSQSRASVPASEVPVALLVGCISFTAVILTLHGLATRVIPRLNLSPETMHRLLTFDTLSNTFLLITFAGALGVRFIPPIIASAVLLFVLLKGTLFLIALTSDERARLYASLGYLSFLFLISGLAALIYQIVWQRVLYAAFGVNIESITIIVSIFMFGLGLGSLVGGLLAARFPRHAPALFLACELGIGAFGLLSIPLMHTVARFTLHGSLPVITLTIFALLAIPTMLMGATLPILVTHLHRHYQSVGRSVGLLYFINTLGSAAACFLTADILFYFLGQQASVLVAAGCNLLVGLLVARYMKRTSVTATKPRTIPNYASDFDVLTTSGWGATPEDDPSLRYLEFRADHTGQALYGYGQTIYAKIDFRFELVESRQLRLMYLSSPACQRFAGFEPQRENAEKVVNYELSRERYSGRDTIGFSFAYEWKLTFSESPWPVGLTLPRTVPTTFYGHGYTEPPLPKRKWRRFW